MQLIVTIHWFNWFDIIHSSVHFTITYIKGRSFYSYIFDQCNAGLLSSHDSLVNRCFFVCRSRNISLYRYLFLDDYAKSHKLLNKSFPIDNGVIDSIMYLLSDFNYEQRVMLQNILMPFWNYFLTIRNCYMMTYYVLHCVLF